MKCKHKKNAVCSLNEDKIKNVFECNENCCNYKQKKQCSNCKWWGKDEWKDGLRSCDNENIIFQTQCSKEECYGYILTAKTFKCKYYKRSKS